jgi:hypothetical protein
MKYRVHFRSNICEYSFNKEYTTMSVFGRHTKLRVFTEIPHAKSKSKQFLVRIILSFLSEKGERIYRMSATCSFKVDDIRTVIRI